MDNLFTSKQHYEAKIVEHILAGKLQLHAKRDLTAVPGTCEEKVRYEVSQRTWYHKTSMQLKDAGYKWYSSIVPPYTIQHPVFSNSYAVLYTARLFAASATAFYLHKNALSHWDPDKQQAWGLCGNNFNQFIELCS